MQPGRQGRGGWLSDPFSVSPSSKKNERIRKHSFLGDGSTTSGFLFCWCFFFFLQGWHPLTSQAVNHVYYPQSRKSKYPQPEPWSRLPEDPLGQAGRPIQEQISGVASWIAILIRSQLRLLFQCHSLGKLSSRETSPGTLSSNCYTEHGFA